jgi:hypothetical protein
MLRLPCSHTTWAGAANINGGVTLDLVNLNMVEVTADQKIEKLGPGNRSGDVFEKKEKQGLAVGGGRWSCVDVGGLLTGGECL